MSTTNYTSALLLPELESELSITRRLLAAVPDGHEDFTAHTKSMKLKSLAGHTAELPSFVGLVLTAPDFDLGAPSDQPKHKFQTSAQNLAAFDTLAAQAIEAVKNTSDEKFREPWSLVYGDYKIFSGDRYNAYRSMALNHLIHHRAQLGVYLRLLGVPVPKTYGPSADEQ